MIIKFPEHVPVKTAISVGILVAAAQAVEGTSFILVGLSFLFLFLSVAAFNLTGGMAYPSGTYVAMVSLLSVQLAVFAKAGLGEALQSTLINGERTMMVYCAGMCSIYAAAYVNKGLRPKVAWLDRMTLQGNAIQIGWACFLVSHIVPLLLPNEYQGTFSQANWFIYLAILIPVYDTVKHTGGRRSFNLIAFITWADLTSNGIFTFSKSATFIASASWVLGALAAGYRISLARLVALCTIGVVAISILTPYAQVGRAYGRDLPFDQALTVAIDLLGHPIELREKYAVESAKDLENTNYYHMYNGPEGILDRLNMFSVDDALIALTDRGQTSSPLALLSYFTNIIPRYLNPGKANLIWGNVYGRELGMIAYDDTSTGISFSPFGDGYHCAQWLGVTVYSFAIFLFCFFMCDALGGNANHSIWALIYILYFLHAAPEGMLNAPVYAGGTISIFVPLVAVTCSRLMPLITNLVSTPSVRGANQPGTSATQVQS